MSTFSAQTQLFAKFPAMPFSRSLTAFFELWIDECRSFTTDFRKSMSPSNAALVEANDPLSHFDIGGTSHAYFDRECTHHHVSFLVDFGDLAVRQVIVGQADFEEFA